MGLFDKPKRPYDITTRKNKDVPREVAQKGMSAEEKKAWNEHHRLIHKIADPTWTANGKIVGIFSSVTDPKNRNLLLLSLAGVIGVILWQQR